MNPARDLRDVVTLLSEAFGADTQFIGRWAFRGMRLAAWLTPLLGSWVFGPGVYGNALMAFVWQEAGRIVGHASVQRLDRWGRQWHIANVAVAAPYRNRGIGRRLMEAALEYIRERGGLWALLQVKADNAPAVHLYRSLGFEPIGGDIRWRAPVSTRRRENTVTLQPLQWSHIGELRDLAVRSLSEEERWWRDKMGMLAYLSYDLGKPVTPLWQWLGLAVYGWYGVWEGSRLVAALGVWGARWRRHGRMVVWVDRRFWGRWEADLVHFGLERLSQVGVGEVRLRMDANHRSLVEALRSAGFQKVLHLVNMRCWVGG